MRRMGRYSILLEAPAVVTGCAAVVGQKEGEGPLGRCFDEVLKDSKAGAETWEQAESMFLNKVILLAAQKAAVKPEDLDLIFSGDLLNQCIGSTFGLREFNTPFVGLFGACSTMALSLALASVAVASGAANTVGAATSSHFCSAERQFRLPLEYGGVRPPTSQWTVTGSGAAIVASGGAGPKVTAVHFGRMVDLQIKDANNMGAAMAPSACDTLKSWFDDTATKPSDYDLILTGDLGDVGRALLKQLMQAEGFTLSDQLYNDCGSMIFDVRTQDVGVGGSGCGCSGSVLCGSILPQISAGTYKRVLFCATGALMSTTSSQQGESIPGICHLVELMA